MEIERCHREIAAIEAELTAGNPDLPGLCLALSDWSAELRILQDEERRQAETRRRHGKGIWSGSGFHGIRALPILALGRRHRESHLLADSAGEEAAQGMG